MAAFRSSCSLALALFDSFLRCMNLIPIVEVDSFFAEPLLGLLLELPFAADEDDSSWTPLLVLGLAVPGFHIFDMVLY